MRASKIYAVASGLAAATIAVSDACQALQKPKIPLQVSILQSRCSRLPTPSTATPNPKKVEKCRRISHLQALAMARRSALRFALYKKFICALFFFFSVSAVAFLIRRAPSASAGGPFDAGVNRFKRLGRFGASQSPLAFMKSKRVLLVSHELSLSGNVSEFRAFLKRLTLWPLFSFLKRIKKVQTMNTISFLSEKDGEFFLGIDNSTAQKHQEV